MVRSVGVVIPAFRPDLDQLCSYVTRLSENIDPDTIHVEIDDPSREAMEAIRNLPVSVHSVTTRRGKGAAVTEGFERLNTDVLAFVDADGATPASSAADMLEPVLKERADLSVGSRRHPDASVSDHQTVLRRSLGDSFAWLARRILNVSLHDYQCGSKAVTAEYWEQIRADLHEPGFAWDIEFIALAAAAGAEVAEIPITWRDQPGSTVAPVSDTLSMLRGLCVARHRAELAYGSRLHRNIDRILFDEENSLVE